MNFVLNPERVWVLFSNYKNHRKRNVHSANDTKFIQNEIGSSYSLINKIDMILVR